MKYKEHYEIVYGSNGTASGFNDFLPLLARTAVWLGRPKAGTQLFQWSVSKRGVPLTQDPVLTFKHVWPKRSSISNGPSKIGPRMVGLPFLTKICEASCALLGV